MRPHQRESARSMQHVAQAARLRNVQRGTGAAACTRNTRRARETQRPVLVHLSCAATHPVLVFGHHVADPVHLLHATCSMQRATHNMQRTACNAQHEARNVRSGARTAPCTGHFIRAGTHRDAHSQTRTIFARMNAQGPIALSFSCRTFSSTISTAPSAVLSVALVPA